MPDRQRKKILSELTDQDVSIYLDDWRYWLRENQLPPPREWGHTVWLPFAGRGWGKALRKTEQLPVPRGWVALGDVVVGDSVFNENGDVCSVLAVYDIDPVSCYRLTFSDGLTADTCSEHQWVTWTHGERKSFLRSPYEDTTKFPDDWPTWRLRRSCGGAELRVYPDSPGPQIRTTQQIVDTLQHGKRGDTNHCIPLAGPLQLTKAELALDPYVLGYWLGDCTTNGGSLAAHPDDQPHLIASLSDFDPRRLSGKYTIGTSGLMTRLRVTGVLGNKHVPAAYLRGSQAQREALLAGLLDSDGFCDKDSGKIEFCNTNQKLSDAVFELATSLGQKPRIYRGRSKLNGQDHGPKWRVCWRPTVNPFRLLRKADRVRPVLSQGLRNHHRMIVDAVPIDPEPMRCLTVDSPNSMFLCGRGMIPTHNTLVGAYCTNQVALSGKVPIINLVGSDAADVRDVMVKGPTGILATSPKGLRPVYRPSNTVVEWPNGVVANTFSAEDPESLRGPQCGYAWCDEIGKWRYGMETWDQLIPGMRLGEDPWICATTTPRTTQLVKHLLSSEHTLVTNGTTYDNMANLPDIFTRTLLSRYEGTTLGQQEIMGKLILENPGALWSNVLLETGRVSEAPQLMRVVVAIDPAVSTSESSDETGIVVAGLGEDGHAYIMDDLSGRYSPDQWAHVAKEAFYKHRADRIVAERNNGGDMVEATLRATEVGRERLPINTVWASRGKYTRAEPIAAIYEQGRAHHVGRFDQLEEQMCEWEPLRGKKSPDRLDAVVWALTELFFEPTQYRSLDNLPMV